MNSNTYNECVRGRIFPHRAGVSGPAGDHFERGLRPPTTRPPSDRFDPVFPVAGPLLKDLEEVRRAQSRIRIIAVFNVPELCIPRSRKFGSAPDQPESVANTPIAQPATTQIQTQPRLTPNAHTRQESHDAALWRETFVRKFAPSGSAREPA